MTKDYEKIVFVSLDTLRSDAIPSNPSPLWPSRYATQRRVRPSLLDEWLSKGAYFYNCISAAPYTSASHAAFFTGLWPRNNGVYEFFNKPLHADTVFSAGHRLGYKTAWKVDFPIILGNHLGLDRDVDRYIVEDDDIFLDYVEAADKVMAFAHFGSPHIPYGFHNLRFGGDRYRNLVSELEDEIGMLPDLPGDQLVETYRDSEDLALLFRYKRVVQHHYERAGYDRLFDLYLEGVDNFLHDRFERFWSRLMESLRGTRWLIVLFADHGEEYDADSYGHHNSLNEGVLRVPLAFIAEDLEPAVHGRRIRSIDLVPTLLDRMGAGDALGRLDGESLRGTVWDRRDYPERPCLAQAYTSDTAEFVAHQAQMLRTGVHTPSLRHVLYKEAVYLGDQKLVRQQFQYTGGGGIFGLQPCPAPDRYFTQAGQDGPWQPAGAGAQAGAMHGILDAYNAAGGMHPPLEVSQEVRQALRNMGYRI